MFVIVEEELENQLHITVDDVQYKRYVLTRVNNGQCAHPVVFAAGCTKLDVVSTVVVDTSLGKHGVVLNLRFPGQGRDKGKCESKQQVQIF